ncbi:MAG: nucleotidyltransferase domain-containing protein [Rhodoglobus sp.]
MNTVLGIAEARSSLPAIVDGLLGKQFDEVVIGSHRRQEAVIVSFDTFQSLTSARSHTVDLRAIQSKSQLVARLGDSRGLRNIAVFGSMARGDHRDDSDIDLLVDADAGTTYFDIAGFESDLEQLFDRAVDVIPRGSLRLDRESDRKIIEQAILL